MACPRLKKPKYMPTISLHADEFNELIGDEFIPLLNKAGGSGFQVTAYTQTWSDVEARIGNKAKAGQVAGNFNTLIMLRVKELATAEMLTNQVDTCEVHTIMEVSGVNDSADPDLIGRFYLQKRRPDLGHRNADDLTGHPHGLTQRPGFCFARRRQSLENQDTAAGKNR